MNRNKAVDQKGNKYCGPLVIAAILGIGSAEAAALIRKERGMAAVKGTTCPDLLLTLRKHGYVMVPDDPPRHYISNRGFAARGDWMSHDWGTTPAPFTPVKLAGPTLAEWCRRRKDAAATHIVEVTNHWVLVRGRKFVDTFTKGEWVFLRSAPHRRKRVRHAWRIERA